MTGPLTEQERAERVERILQILADDGYASFPDELRAHFAALSASLLAAQEALRQRDDDYAKLLRAADKRVAALERTLRFYAKSDNYFPSYEDQTQASVDCPALEDGGERARALLGVSAEPLKDTDGATAKLSPVAEEGQS